MFKNMKIGLRLALSFSFLIILMIVIIITGLMTINNVNTKFKTIVTVENIRTRLANNMIDNAREVALSVRGTLLVKYNNESDANIQKMKDGWNESWRKYHKNIAEIKEIITENDTSGFILINEIEAYGDSAQLLTSKAIEQAVAGNTHGATTFVFTKAYPSVLKWIQSLNDLIEHENERTLLRFNEAEKLYVNRRIIMLILGALAIALSVAIVVLLTVGITKPLYLSVNAANKIASGDLTIDFSTTEKREDELGVLIQAFSKMTENLRRSTADISEAINMLSSSASEILAATTQVASGSAETATAISETTTTVEEVRQAAQLSSQKAGRVSENAQQVAQVTQAGQKAVDETINGMREIQIQMEAVANTIVRLSEQSQQIGGIIASVTDVADQSNLLAVNASIEAAKAGEQGKGFAVVAQEIKDLAQQSKQATIQVRNILNDIQKATSAAVMATEQTSKAVENGVRQSAQTGESIKKLAESSSKAVEAATQIVASSQQQVVGMDQIGLAMNNINQAGTENAASMVQAEKAAKGLNELGQKLKLLVEQYKI
jgi:methyl-accepting chemotaxis protein